MYIYLKRNIGLPFPSISQAEKGRGVSMMRKKSKSDSSTERLLMSANGSC